MMDERVQFVACRLAGEPMADLRREFGISRKTGYKIFGRYQECEVQGCTSLASMDAFLFLQRTERRTHLPTPKLNAHVERSHRTHHEEFY